MTTIGITMGCPVGIGPEIILKYFISIAQSQQHSTVVIGDINVLKNQAIHFQMDIECYPWSPGEKIRPQGIPVFSSSCLDQSTLQWGKPTKETGSAMGKYIEDGVKLCSSGDIDGIATCPITKSALQLAGYTFPGHTEMLAQLTDTERYTMMMAGSSLRVTLATIHCSLFDVKHLLTTEVVLDQIRIMQQGLMSDFGIEKPKIGVAALNPHAGEDTLFGSEEKTIIAPAITQARKENIDALGPFPPDTIFYKASQGEYDGVVCMYHDQGLIPFKLLHFNDGVNITIGLPLVRTSVDHGTAYDIAGQGIANPESLLAAVSLAREIVNNRNKKRM